MPYFNDLDRMRQQAAAVNPRDEFIVMFSDGVNNAAARQTLSQAFAKYGRGKIVVQTPTLPGDGPTIMIKDATREMIAELSGNKDIRSIGPNRRATMC